MACIDCGLGLDVNGKGFVEVDTDGGLQCIGTGGSTANSSSQGLSIKVDPAAGNSLVVDGDGAFVPPAFRMETYYGTVSGSLADPLFGSGGTSYTSDPASIALTNTTAYDKVYMYQGVVYYSSASTTTPFWIELATSEGGGYSVPSAQYIATGSIVSPLMMLPQAISVPAGTSKTISAKMVAYRGNLTTWRVSITAWGGYS